MTPGELAERLAYQLGGLAGAIFFCFIVSIIAGRRDTGLRTDFLFSLFILLFVFFFRTFSHLKVKIGVVFPTAWREEAVQKLPQPCIQRLHGTRLYRGL